MMIKCHIMTAGVHLDDPPRISLSHLGTSSKMKNAPMPMGRDPSPPRKPPILCRSRGAYKEQEDGNQGCDDEGAAHRHDLFQ